MLVEHIESKVNFVMKSSPISNIEKEVAKPGENMVLRSLSESDHIIKVKDIHIW